MEEFLALAAQQASADGHNGLVLAAAPQAAALGAEVMRQGGNAFDAVVVAGLAETVLLPPKCGLGGDLVALAVDGPGVSPEALIAIGGAADQLGASFRESGRTVTGPLAVGIPGAPTGYAALAERGNLPLATLVMPAIRLAEEGFAWAPVCTDLANQAAQLVSETNPHPTRYYPDGRVPQPGERFVLPGLARLLEEFAHSGADLFRGRAGVTVSDYVMSLGGVITPEDFRHGQATWETPAHGTAGGHRLWATPTPTHGPGLVTAMAGAEPGDNQGRVWERTVRGRAAVGSLSDPGGTSMVSATDRDGRTVTVIHSNSFPQFGSGLVVPDYDLILSNRPGRGFGDDPEHPNFPAPGKRPTTTLHAWCLDLGADGVMLGGTPGGDNQMPWNTQLLSQFLAGTKDPGRLVVSPRWAWTPPDSIRAEAGFSEHDLTELRRQTSRLTEIPIWGLRSAQQVLVVRPDGSSAGGVDPRTGGLALAV